MVAASLDAGRRRVQRVLTIQRSRAHLYEAWKGFWGVETPSDETHTQKYMTTLLHHIEVDDVDPSFIITDRITLDEAPAAYAKFDEKKDGCVKGVMKP